MASPVFNKDGLIVMKLNHSLFLIIRNSGTAGLVYLFRDYENRKIFKDLYQNGYDPYVLRKEKLETQFIHLVKNNVSNNSPKLQVTKILRRILVSEKKGS